MIIISNFLSNFINFCAIVSFFPKLLTLGILFSTVVRETLVAKLVTLGISPSTSFILALRVVSVATLVISGILSSIFFILALYTSFLTTSLFTTLPNLPKSKGTGTNLSTSNLFTFLLKLLKWVGRFFTLSISNLSTSDSKVAKSVFFYQKKMYQLLLHF